MAVCDDSVKPNFMKIRCFKLQHLMYTLLIDLVRRGADFFWSAIGAAESRGDELLAIFVQKVESIEVGAGRDFDQLGKAISDLRGWEST